MNCPGCGSALTDPQFFYSPNNECPYCSSQLLGGIPFPEDESEATGKLEPVKPKEPEPEIIPYDPTKPDTFENAKPF